MKTLLEKITGIIIKTQDYSETHKIVTIFSKKIGLFSALARGAKKPKSRMAAVAQPFIYGEFLIYIGKGLSTIQQGDILDSNRAIREDIIKTAYATYIGELTYKLVEQKKPVPHLFVQFMNTLEWIAEKDDIDVPIMMYELKVYQEGGFAPTVDRCINCGIRTTSYSFSINEGGLLCQNCLTMDPYAINLPNALVKLLYLFANVGIEQVGTINVKKENQQLLRHILDQYYNQYGGFEIKSKKVLKQILDFM